MLRKSLYSLPIALLVTLSGWTPAQAENFSLPAAGDDIIGAIRHTRARQEDTLIDIARRFSVGQDEMVMANQNVDRWLPKAGTDVLIPQEYILPDAPRSGIVVNIPEMRMYYFPIKARPAPARVVKSKKPSAPVCKPVANAPATGKSPAKAPVTNGKSTAAKPPVTAAKKAATPPGKPSAASAKPAANKSAPAAKIVCQPASVSKQSESAPAVESTAGFESAGGEVITYPVSMGRMDWRTPLGMTRVIDKQKDPSWTPPASIKREHAAKGDPLPDVVPPGPDNPLGKYAMRLGVAGYLIHGTDAAKADGIGMRVTHGCMRMYNEDVAKLFPLIPVGAPVYLVNQPVKMGWKNGLLYMEVSQPLDEDVGLRGHDPDENVSKAQLEREDSQRAGYLLKKAAAELDKIRAKTGISVNMEKVRKAVTKPTGIPLVIGGHEGDSSWESAATSDQGLAPSTGSSKADGPDSADEDSGYRPRPMVPSRLPVRETYGNEGQDEPAPAPRLPKRILPVPLPDEEAPAASTSRMPSRATPRPLDAESSSSGSRSEIATGVKTIPYSEGEETESEEEQ